MWLCNGTKTLDKYFSLVNLVVEIANCDSQLQCCSVEGSGTNTNQLTTSEVVVITSDEENDEELNEKEVGEQMVMQEQEKEYAETVVSSNAYEYQCYTQINVAHHPIDVSGSVVSLNYSASGKRKKHSRKIQTTWYKRYPKITVCTSTYRIICVMCHSALYFIFTQPKQMS